MSPHRFARRAICFALLFLCPNAPAAAAGAFRTQNVILITTDGFRWQEVFGGAEEALLTTNQVPKNLEKLKRRFSRETSAARREALLPFFWNVIGRQGQLWGNTNLGSVARVSNPHKFSYPGYNELLTGHADPRIDSNDKTPNPNTNVLEWLAARRPFHGRCAAFASWDVMSFILNRARSGLPVRAGIEPIALGRLSPRQELLNELIGDTTPLWDDLLHDSFLFHGAMDYFQSHHPRVLYLAFDETDDWAHEGRYDRYLQAAHRVDECARRIWETAQSLPAYRGKTTLLLTADHGRGSGPQAWKDHGKDVAGSEYIWLAALGPDIPALGERRQTPPVWQNQIAATLAALLRQDYAAAFPAAGRPISALFDPAPR